jgi:hypothetical protein
MYACKSLFMCTHTHTYIHTRAHAVIAAYLLYCKQHTTSKEALFTFADARTKNRQGVTIPSQQVCERERERECVSVSCVVLCDRTKNRQGGTIPSQQQV